MAEVDSPVVKKKNWFLRHKILTAILAIIVIAAIASAAGGSKSNQSNTSSTSNTPTKSNHNQNKASTVAKLNEPARDGKFEFTVTGFKCGDASITSPDSSYLTTNAQGQFCQMNLSVKNIGNVQQNFTGNNQYVYSDSGTQYSYSGQGTIYANPSGSSFAEYQDVNPGVTVTGVLVFDVQKGVTPAYAVLHDSSASNGIRVNLQ